MSKQIGTILGILTIFLGLGAIVLLENKTLTITEVVKPAEAPVEPAKPTETPESPLIAQITAETKIKVGQLLVLQAGPAEADNFAWKVMPETKNFLVIDNGKRACFSAETPGIYVFILATTKNGIVDVQMHAVQVGDSQVVGVQGWLAKVADYPGKREDQLKLAQSFSSVAALITSGVINSPEDISAATKKSNQDALGDNYAKWEPFFVALRDELNALAAAGKLTDGASHATKWREIAVALQ